MLLDFITIDRSEKGEFYHRLYEKLKAAVENGAIKKGEKLPSIRQAAEQLGVSRTTVENAYMRLCIEGIAESLPQRGYFITGNTAKASAEESLLLPDERSFRYDFSSRKIDKTSADTELWKKLVRGVLTNSDALISYGNPQGEPSLRKALAEYCYKARGVNAAPENIVIGAGITPLLNILCGIVGRNVCVGLEGGFKTAENIFRDYGIEAHCLECDQNGAVTDKINGDMNFLFLQPATLSKISVTALSKRRSELKEWVERENRIIVEDDYNGELRYTARSLPAFQSKAPERTVYIGSFSKLLLPSVRIAYMVLPPVLAEKFRAREGFNPTCGKVEQLALTEYILSGALEKHLRRLRRLYYAKSQLLCATLSEKIDGEKEIVLYETMLTVELRTAVCAESREICDRLARRGIRVMPSPHKGAVRLSFAGIEATDIPDAVEILAGELKNF